MAETLLKSQMTGFHRTAWAVARARHGPRAALAVIETALIVRLRAGTEDPIRSAPAYLGGILRRKPQDCRPEITLQRLAAARAAKARGRQRCSSGEAGKPGEWTVSGGDGWGTRDLEFSGKRAGNSRRGGPD